MHSVSVRSALARRSSTVKPLFNAATCCIGLILRPVSGGVRSTMRDLSRWMCVSTSPPQASRPPASYVSASAAKPFSMATMLPPATPTSTGSAAGSFASRTLRTMRSIRRTLFLDKGLSRTNRHHAEIPRRESTAERLCDMARETPPFLRHRRRAPCSSRTRDRDRIGLRIRLGGCHVLQVIDGYSSCPRRPDLLDQYREGRSPSMGLAWRLGSRRLGLPLLGTALLRLRIRSVSRAAMLRDRLRQHRLLLTALRQAGQTPASRPLQRRHTRADFDQIGPVIARRAPRDEAISSHRALSRAEIASLPLTRNKMVQGYDTVQTLLRRKAG